MTLEQWLEHLKPGEIPIFGHTHARLRELSPRRDEITAKDVASVVLSDPLATLQIIHSLNKRVLQRYGTEVLTVEHALMMLGLGVYLDSARRFTTLEDSPVGKDRYRLNACYTVARKAQHAAWQARDFAILHTDVRAEEVEVAALLNYAPEMLLWLRSPDTARTLRRLRRRLPIQAAEQKSLGVPGKALRLQLLESWSVPPTTLDLLDDKNAQKARQIILASCLNIAERSERGWWDDNLLIDYIALAGVENTPMETIIANVHSNAARVARHGNWVPVATAACWGPMLPGPWPRDEDDEEDEAPVSKPASLGKPAPSPAVAPPRQAPQEEIATHTVCPMPDKHVLREALQGIEGHMDGSLTLNQMSAIILKGLHTGLGLTRILFAMTTPDGNRAKSRFTLGIPVGDPLRQFEFALNGNDLFCQLMRKMQGVWVNDENREKLWPMVSPALQKIVGKGDFYAMSLHANNRVVGLIYADRGHGECGLDNNTYTDFKMLCLQAARGLGKIRE